MTENSTTRQQSTVTKQVDQLKQVELELTVFSNRIDSILRRHYANRVLRKLLLPIQNSQEKKIPDLWKPSGLSILAGVVTLFLVLSLLSSLTFLPKAMTEWVSIALAIFAALKVESKLLPKLFFARYRFRLMRLEKHLDGGEYPDHYIVAHADNSPTGFGAETWKSTWGVEPGHLLISVQDSKKAGVAIIQLRTEGKLPVTSWPRDLYKDNVLPPLPEEVKVLAHEFDKACDKYSQVAQKIENSRVLRSKKDEPVQRDVEQAWKNIAIAPAVKVRLMSLAKHFADGSAAASRGLLLYGPPGTGKTMIAKTLAESMGCSFFPLSLPDLKAGYIGQSGEKVKELWQRALAQPRSVIFVDECEGVFSRRGGVNTDSFAEEIVQSFLAQWDGFTKQTTVWVVGATNRRDLIDPAILSRFGEEVEIGLPSEQQRLEIFSYELTLKGMSGELPPEAGELTQGMSGRDIGALAGRLAREQSGAQITGELLSRYTQDSRKQGSTQTDAGAVWEKLILSETVLKDLKQAAELLKKAEVATKRGFTVPRGLLLYGPPGTGKTQIARTLANETGLRFIAASTADMKAGFIGQSGQKVKELFERARESAPSLLFLDELDIVAPARGAGGNNDQFTQEIVGQLLQEMDGVKAHSQSVFVLAATNCIDQIDPAVLSRFQKRVEIPIPDSKARQQLLQVMLHSKPIAFDLREVSAYLAEHGVGMSGRDLRNWIEQAEQNAIGRAMEAGDFDSATITLEDFPLSQRA